MGEIGSGINVPSWPGTLDTNSSPEVDTVPGVSVGTVVRAKTINDLSEVSLKIEEILGVNPQGSMSDIKTFLQAEHNADGTHLMGISSTRSSALSLGQQQVFTYASDALAAGGYIVLPLASEGILQLQSGIEGGQFNIQSTGAVTTIVKTVNIEITNTAGKLSVYNYATNIARIGNNTAGAIKIRVVYYYF